MIHLIFKQKLTSGFTLIELLLAITIAVILGSAIYGTLSAGLNSSKKGNYMAERNQIARAAFEQLRNDLFTVSLSSTTPSWAFTATTVAVGSTYNDTLQFVATNQIVDWNIPGTSDEAIIKYAIDTVPDSGNIGLLRTINRHVTDLESTDLQYQLISLDVASLHFEYYDGTQWLEEWTETTKLPKVVKVTMGLRDTLSPETLNWYSTSIRLPKA